MTFRRQKLSGVLSLSLIFAATAAVAEEDVVLDGGADAGEEDPQDEDLFPLLESRGGN